PPPLGGRACRRPTGRRRTWRCAGRRTRSCEVRPIELVFGAHVARDGASDDVAQLVGLEAGAAALVVDVGGGEAVALLHVAARDHAPAEDLALRDLVGAHAAGGAA